MVQFQSSFESVSVLDLMEVAPSGILHPGDGQELVSDEEMLHSVVTDQEDSIACRGSPPGAMLLMEEDEGQSLRAS